MSNVFKFYVDDKLPVVAGLGRLQKHFGWTRGYEDGKTFENAAEDYVNMFMEDNDSVVCVEFEVGKEDSLAFKAHIKSDVPYAPHLGVKVNRDKFYEILHAAKLT